MNGFVEQQKLQRAVLHNFFEKNGKLKHLPAQLKKRLIVLEFITSQLDTTKKYKEFEINVFIKHYHEDYATIRRELFIHRFLNREREIYEINNREDWHDWRLLQ